MEIQVIQVTSMTIIIRVVQREWFRKAPVHRCGVMVKHNGKEKRHVTDKDGNVVCWTQAYRGKKQIEFVIEKTRNHPAVTKMVRW